MNKFMNGLVDATNFTLTENGALTCTTTKNNLLDMFAMGASMRNRSDEDVILMFRKAYTEDPIYAMKCLFYIRDIRGGQGERRFFRLCMKDLVTQNVASALRNFKFIPEFGRWDDLYVFEGTSIEKEVFDFMKHQLALDVSCETPSLLAKWLKSENASSQETRRLAIRTRKAFGLTAKEYRKILSALRTKINIVEKLMSENRWDEIQFDKIPSKAGFIYKNAFARRDIIKTKYEAFATDVNTKVNAGTLYPYEVIEQITNHFGYYATSFNGTNTDRAMLNKYWDNLTDYFKNSSLNALAVVDTSGSMRGTPMNVAISLGMYCAEKCNGPFANHYISFSSRPQLVKVEGIDFVDKVSRIYATNLCENTNIEATFDLLLKTAVQNNCSQEDLPQNIIIISDMEFDAARGFVNKDAKTLMEDISLKWNLYGYEMPKLIFWNVDARQNNVPMIGNNPISYVSGFSPSIFQSILSGKTGLDLMFEKLDSPRYECIR